MDTPGVLWPKFEDQNQALILASFSSIKEETALYTILSILTNTDKDWKIYSDYIDLVSLVIDVMSKSPNKQSRLYKFFPLAIIPFKFSIV